MQISTVISRNVFYLLKVCVFHLRKRSRLAGMCEGSLDLGIGPIIILSLSTLCENQTLHLGFSYTVSFAPHGDSQGQTGQMS